MKSISATEANDRMGSEDFIVLDIRERYEVDAAAVPEFLHIPMMEIPQRLDELPKDKQIGVLCHHGNRSARVTMFLMQKGFDNVVNITGGIEAWSIQTEANVPRYQKSFGRARIIG